MAVVADNAAGRVRALAAPLATTAAVLAGAAYTAIENPHTGGFFPPCLYYELSGLYCPGCGGMRAAHDLLHGDIAGAMSMNPYAVLVIIPVIAIALVWWLGSAAGLGWRAPRVPTPVIWAMIASAGVFAVLRNVPLLAPYLGPGA
jgi:hypothetical protein